MGGWIYIMANKPHGVLYIGVTADLAARMMQHRGGPGSWRGGSAFVRRYGIDRLVLVEHHPDIQAAIGREKSSKTSLIEQAHPDRRDLFDDLLG